MQYKVPQSIDMEDKIVGPFTLRQFLYLLFGGLIDYIAYRSLFESAPALFWFIFIPVSLATLALAVIKIRDRPFDVYLKNAILFMLAPKERTWQKDSSIEQGSVITTPAAPKTAATPPPKKQPSPTELEKVSQILDTYGQGHGQVSPDGNGSNQNQPTTTGQHPESPPDR